MSLTQLSIKRPLLMTMVLLGLVLFGAVAYTRLGADRYPQINIPYISIVVPYPGAGPEEVESRVTKLVEDTVAGSANLKTLRSYSLDGISIVSLEFKIGADVDTAAVDVERKLSAVRSMLPEEARAPSVAKAEFDSMPIMSMSLSGAIPDYQLYRLADESVKGRMEAVSGVASVRIVGGREREIQVKVDQSRLQARGISIQQVQAALAQGNISVPSGSINDRGLQYNIRLNGLVQRPDDLNEIIISSTPSGAVYLRDVAEVVDGFKKQELINSANGTESVGVLVTKASGASTMEVAKELQSTAMSVQKGLPEGVRLTVADDTSVFVKQSLDDIQTNLIYAVILTAVVLLFFLHSFRSTIIVLFSIPTSLISTFLVMWAMGFTLNMMSMMALALSIGILVDDSIVVLENIFRHLKLGETPWTAALKGRSEIGMAAMAITLVDVVVYVPMGFMSGMVGQFFREFGITVATATLVSLFVSFTLTPMLASRWLKAEPKSRSRSPLQWFGRFFEKGYNRLARAYRGVLIWALGHRKTVVFGTLVIFMGSMSLIPLNLIGAEFLPVEDQGTVQLDIEKPPGTPLNVTSGVVKQLEARLEMLPEVSNYFSTVGLSTGMGVTGDGRRASINVKLVDKNLRSKSIVQMQRTLQSLGDNIPGLTLRAQLPDIVGSSGQPFQVVLKGEDSSVLRKLASQVATVLKNVPGAADVTNSGASGAAEAQFQVDHQRLADLGLTSAALAAALRTDVEGVVVSQLRPEGQNRVDIRVVGSDIDRSNVASLSGLPVVSSKGVSTRLEQATTLKFVDSPTQIERLNRQHTISIGANIIGRPIGDVARDFREGLKSVSLPAGYSVALAGETESMDESFTSMIAALGLSILLMYMLMVALYESPVYPLVIMFALPVSMVGALGGLFLTGHTLNINSMIGMIMLMGLVGKNGILLVDYTNTLRSRGKSRFDAIVEAGPTRLRPILMTTSAMVMAMTPMALQLGAGAAGQASMAVVVIGGLISSTLLTLALVPVMYTLFDDLQVWVGVKVFRRGAKAEGSQIVDAANEPARSAVANGV